MHRRNFLKVLSLTAIGVSAAQLGIAMADTKVEFPSVDKPQLFEPTTHLLEPEDVLEFETVKDVSSGDLYVTVVTVYKLDGTVHSEHTVKIGTQYTSWKRFNEYVDSFGDSVGRHSFVGRLYEDGVLWSNNTFESSKLDYPLLISPAKNLALTDLKESTPSFLKKNYVAALYN